MTAFVEMDATLLNQDPDPAKSAQNKSSGMAGNGAAGHTVNILEGNLQRIFESLREGAQTRAENVGHVKSLQALSSETFCQSLVNRDRCPPGHRNIPATVAVIQEANAPPIMARRAKREISGLRSGASGAMPPIWIPIEAKLAKPHKA